MTVPSSDTVPSSNGTSSNGTLGNGSGSLAEPLSHSDAGGSGERAVPYYCPYCGEEDLRPEPEPRAAWRCVGCTRVFVVRFVGLSASGVATR